MWSPTSFLQVHEFLSPSRGFLKDRSNIGLQKWTASKYSHQMGTLACFSDPCARAGFTFLAQMLLETLKVSRHYLRRSFLRSVARCICFADVRTLPNKQMEFRASGGTCNCTPNCRARHVCSHCPIYRKACDKTLSARSAQNKLGLKYRARTRLRKSENSDQMERAGEIAGKEKSVKWLCGTRWRRRFVFTRPLSRIKGTPRTSIYRLLQARSILVAMPSVRPAQLPGNSCQQQLPSFLPLKYRGLLSCRRRRT